MLLKCYSKNNLRERCPGKIHEIKYFHKLYNILENTSYN